MTEIILQSGEQPQRDGLRAATKDRRILYQAGPGFLSTVHEIVFKDVDTVTVFRRRNEDSSDLIWRVKYRRGTRDEFLSELLDMRGAKVVAYLRDKKVNVEVVE